LRAELIDICVLPAIILLSALYTYRLWDCVQRADSEAEYVSASISHETAHAAAIMPPHVQHQR
jgi:hypothetical protein